MLLLRYEWLPVMSVAPGNRQSSTSSARDGAVASALCVGVTDLLYIACQAFSALIHRKPKFDFFDVCAVFNCVLSYGYKGDVRTGTYSQHM